LFKRDVKKYSNFLNYITLLEVLSKLEKFLGCFEDISTLSISEDSTKWCIQLENATELPKEAEIIIYDPEEVVGEVTCNDSMIRDDVSLGESITTSPAKENDFLSQEINNEQIKLDFHPTESELDVSKPKKRKLNTLNDLDKAQVEWIREQVSNSGFLKGKKRLFKCPQCQVVLCTQASLIRHLRDLHILKNPTDEKTILKEEVANSKLIIDTENGKEIVWKCSRCERDRIYKSEQAFKVHFRMNHIRDKKIDSSFIANCKTTTMIENEGMKDVWKCPECSKIFRHRDGLRHHLKSVHPNSFDETKSDFNETADRSIQDISRLTEKVQNKNVSKGENFCNECGVKFILCKHHVKPKIHQECHEIFKHLAPRMPHYRCDRCRIIFNSETSLFEHLDIHNNLELINLIPTEGLITFGASYYKEAVGDADDACLDEAVWKCGHCSVRYFDENDCVVHQLLLHSATIYCFVDNREFQGLSGLSKYLQHMKNKHPEFFPNISYTCSSCKLEFPTIYEKLSHQKVCDLKKFECDHCGKRYSAKHQLQAHILFELGFSGFSCDQCGKKCKTMSDLKIHQNTHTGLRPYFCTLCDKTFKTPAARSSHMEKHLLEEGITCEICNAKLTNRTLYQRHKRFQHDQEFRESQYEKNTCTLCDKSFLRTSHFKQHLKQHHNL